MPASMSVCVGGRGVLSIGPSPHCSGPPDIYPAIRLADTSISKGNKSATGISPGMSRSIVASGPRTVTNTVGIPVCLTSRESHYSAEATDASIAAAFSKKKQTEKEQACGLAASGICGLQPISPRHQLAVEGLQISSRGRQVLRECLHICLQGAYAFAQGCS
jgi:hypothetical protein